MHVAQQLYRAGLSLPLKVVNYFLQLKSDLVFVVFRKAPGIGKLFFRLHWRGTVDRKTYARHFCPRYNPWQQRIPVAIGFKQLLRDGAINLVTGRMAGFVENGIRLDDGSLLETDTCIFATGFNLQFFRFHISIDHQPLSMPGINFYKAMMMGGIPNYFQPFGPPHTSFTRRIEIVSKHIVKIILHMRKQQLDSVSIARKRVDKAPAITPGYIMRNLADLPAFYGTVELPSIDNLVFYHFKPGDYIFSRATDTTSRGNGIGVAGNVLRRSIGQQIDSVNLNEQQS
jgi:cation diffusion facilitator CzcD-associated flavoprotein CzcO